MDGKRYKVTLRQVSPDDEEIIIKYSELTPKLEAAIELLSDSPRRLYGTADGETEKQLFNPSEALYFESVDSYVYVYLADKVLRVQGKLDGLLVMLERRGFIRCSRTMIVNIYKIARLKSEAGGRILASLENGEQILISRRYASGLRERLMNGR